MSRHAYLINCVNTGRSHSHVCSRWNIYSVFRGLIYRPSATHITSLFCKLSTMLEYVIWTDV